MATTAFRVFESVAITRAGVYPFLGSEMVRLRDRIEPDETYYLLRGPEAWAESADSWSAVAILRGHPERGGGDFRNMIIGTTDGAWFADPHLFANLLIWNAEALADIGSGARRGLSLGYSGPATLRSGTYRGRSFDGEIGPITGHHIALTPRSRTGLFLSDDQATHRRALPQPQQVAAELQGEVV